MDPYKILGIDKDASKDEIRGAYRKQAAKYHPDSGGDAWIFQQIQDAYDDLTGKKKKKKKPKDSANAKQAPPTGANDPFQESPFGNGPFEFDIPNPEPSQGRTFRQTYKTKGARKRKKKKFNARKLALVAGSGGGILVIVVLLFFMIPTFSRSWSEKVAAKNDSNAIEKTKDATPAKPRNAQKYKVPHLATKSVVEDPTHKTNPVALDNESNDRITKPALQRSTLLPIPILALTFDNTGNSVAGPNVEVSGGAKTVGYVGNSLTLQSSSYAKTSMIFPTGGSSRTLAVWLKSNRSSVFRNVHVIQYGQPQSKASFGLMIARNKWRFFDWDGGLDSGKVIDTDWHHHCITYDGNELIYYLDGEVVARETHQLQTKQGPLFLGKRGMGYPSGFEGQIDEVVVYYGELSQEQVARLVALGREGKHPAGGQTSRSLAASQPKRNIGVPARNRNPSRPSVAVTPPRTPKRTDRGVSVGSNTPQRFTRSGRRNANDLSLQLRGTKWMNSNNVTFEWTTNGKFLHNGTEREWRVVNGDRVQIVFNYNHVDTLVFDASMKNFQTTDSGRSRIVYRSASY